MNGFKLIGFKSGMKVLGVLSVAAALSACGGTEDIRKSVSMEYLDAKTGKPIVYPAGVDAPEVSDAFAIPPLPPGKRANSADINDLVQPPSLLPPEQRPSTVDEDEKNDDKTAMIDPEPEISAAEAAE